MIVFKKGNLFDSECQALVNTVNCIGVMGAGIAKQYKQRYPEMFDDKGTSLIILHSLK